MAAGESLRARTSARRRAAKAVAVFAPVVLAGALVAPTLAGGGSAAESSAAAAAQTNGGSTSADGGDRATPSSGTTSNATGLSRVGTIPPVPSGARALGALSSSTAVSLDVALRPADPSALERFANDVSDPTSSDYGHYLKAGQFSARFGPSAAATSAVRKGLAAAGLTVGAASADGLLLHVSGSAAQVSSALHVSLERYRLHSGRVGFSATATPLLPESVSGDVVGISGLSTLVRARPLLQSSGNGQGTGSAGGSTAAVPSAAGHGSGPAACTAATTAATKFHLNPWTQIAKAYGFTAAYAKGDLGAGSTVGIYELEPYSSADLATFESCFALPGTEHYGQVQNLAIDGGAGAGPGSGEAILDVEDVLALAPETNVVMYNAPNTNVGALDEYDVMVSSDQTQVISTSWGECELYGTTVAQSVENEIFQEAAAQGQSVFAAAGDTGSEDCHLFTATSPPTTTFPYTPQATTVLAVDDPASQPYVTGVGGTQLTLTAAHPTTPHEVVWNSDTGTKPRQIAGGGGVSDSWAKPSWQRTQRIAVPPPGTGRCSASPGSPTTSATCRQVPDVSATADPTKGGDEIYCKGASLCTTIATLPSTHGWAGVGGTSDAAPLWAALTSLADESCGTDVGFLNPRLYKLGDASGDFHDVTSGTNDATGAQAGDYSATAGYDNASGLGSPDAAKLLATVCPGTVDSPHVHLSTTHAGATTRYGVTFTAAHGLVGNDSITLLGPAGTAFPSAIADYTLTETPMLPPVVVDNTVESVTPFSTGFSPSTNAVTLTYRVGIGATTHVALVVKTVVSAQEAGAHTLQVQTTATSSTSADAAFTLTAGAPSATTSTVVASAPSVPDDGTTSDTITVTVRDRWGNPLSTAPVTLSGALKLGASAPTVIPATATTSTAGTAEFTVTDGGPAEVDFSATIGTVTVAQTAAVDFTALSAASASLTPPTAGATSKLTAAFTTPVALSTGSTVTITAPPGSTLPGSSAPYLVGASSHPTGLTLSDGPGSTRPNRATITLATGIAATGVVSIRITTVTNTTAIGTSVVALSTSHDPVPVDVAVSIVAGAPTPATSTVTVVAPSGPADGLSPDAVVVTVRDHDGNPVEGADVSLSHSGHATFTPTPPNAVSDSTGGATFVIADATAEVVTVTAKATGNAVGSASVSFTGISALDYLPLTTLTASGTVDLTTGAKVDMEAFAQLPGQLLAGTTITLSAPPGTSLPLASADYSVQNAFGRTQSIRSIRRSKGQGSSTTNVVTLTLTSPTRLDKRDEFVIVAAIDVTNPAVPGTSYATIAASGAGDTAPSFSQPMTFTVGPPSKSKSTVVATPTTVDIGTSSTVTVTVADASGNRLSGQVVSLSPSTPGATVKGDGSTATARQSTTTGAGKATFRVSDVTAQEVTFSAEDVTATVKLPSASVTFVTPHKTTPPPKTTTPPPPPPPPPPPAPAATGYDLVGSDGGVFVFDTPGTSGGFYGSLPGDHVTPRAPIVGMVPTTTDQGYFLVGADGGVFAFGNAPFLGSLPLVGVAPTQPITGIVAANTDRGYFLVGRDGGVFAFGTVPFLGSLPERGISVDNIIGIAATPSGNGYWLISSTGTVYTFGVPQLGTVKGTPSPVSAIAGTPTGGGYWITTQNGAVYAFGSAKKYGTLPALHVQPAHPVIGIVHTAGTGGYWLLGSDGGIFAFGDAPFMGSLPGLTVHVTDIVGAVPT